MKKTTAASGELTPGDLIPAGTIGRPHGLHGGLFINGRDTPFPKHVKKIFIGQGPGQVLEAGIKTFRQHAGGRLVLYCSLAGDRSTAEGLKGQTVYLQKSDLNIDLATEYLWCEVPGQAVIDATGLEIGRVLSIYNAGASDILIVADPAGRQLDIPCVSDYVEMDTLGQGQLRLRVAGQVWEGLWSTK